MNRLLIAIASVIIFLTAPVLYASEATTSDQQACADISSARKAHTVGQYSALADCYAARQRVFRRKAAEEMHLWAERNAMINPLSEKWPRPVDSARNLHDYYEFKAGEAARLQAKYNKLADEASAK